MKSKKQNFIGFAFVGLLCTLLTFGGIFVFNNLLKWNIYISYGITYFITIGISYYLNTILVFKIKVAFKKLIKYYLIYLSSLFIGFFVLIIISTILPQLNPTIRGFLVIPFTTMYNFFFTNRILNSRKILPYHEC